MTIEIATYWNVETLYYVFNAVASVMAASDFEGMLKMIFLFAIGVGIFAYAGNKQLEMAKWFIQALIFVTILNLPIATVILTDKTNLEPPRSVDNVPFALAVVAQTSTLVSGWLTETYETVFSVPDDIGLQKGDLGFGHRILKNVNKAIVRDPGLRADLMQFFKECTLRDIDDGVIDPADIVSGTDVWNTVFNNTSPARFVIYDNLTGVSTVDTCENVAEILEDRVDAAVTAAQTFYGKQAFTRVDADNLASSMYGSAVGTSYDWILASSASASEALRQSMFNNIWRDAGTELPTLLGDTARVAEVNAMTASAQAAIQAAGANASISILAQETLPHMRNWIEAILYAMFPIVVVLVVLSTAEGAKKVLGGYMMSLAWIGMWPVLFAVINHLSLMHMRYKARTLDLAAGVPFQLSDVFDATLSDEQALIGYMVVLVPFISAAVIKMGQGGIMSLADRMMAGFSSAVHGAGYQHSAGNYSMGHVGADSASLNHTTMSKYDSDLRNNAGGAAITAPNGEVWRYSSNGTFAADQYGNHMQASPSIDSRYDANLSAERQRSDIAGNDDRLAYRGSEISQGSETSGYGTERGDSQREREMVTTGFQGRYTTDSVDGQGNQVNRGSTSHWRENSEGQDSVNLGLRSPRGGGSGSPAGGIYSADNKSVLESETSQVSETNGYGTERGDSQREGETATTGFQGSYTSDSIAGRSTQVSQGSTSHWRENLEGQGSTNTGSDDRGKGGYRMPVGGGGGTLKTDTAGQGRNDQNARRHDHGAYADPAIMEQVADRHGMTVPRFHNLPPASKQEMFDEYLSEMETVKSAKTRQSDTFAGETLSAHAGKLTDRTLAQRRTLNEEEGNVRDRQDAKAAATGAGAIGPLGIDTSMPSHVDEARGQADADYANNESGTVVYHNTSPDRPVDAGLRSELGVAHESASNDAKDGVATATIKVEDTAESAVDTVKSGSSGDKK